MREKKSPVSMQAVIDDSGSDCGDKRLFFAGFVDSAERWAEFAHSWNAELTAGRPIDYLKMSEANFYRDQFRGWSRTERNGKISRLKAVIDRFKPMSFHSSVARAAEWENFKAVAPRGLANPQFVCCFSVISILSQHFANSRLSVKIEFIFDQQNGLDDDIDLFFEFMMRRLPREAQELIAAKPVFRDDKLFAPIQAADLLAWHLRRAHEVHGCWDKGNTNERSPINACGHLWQETDALVEKWTQELATLPAIAQMQSKPQWRRLKSQLRRDLANGYVPPYGTRLKNIWHSFGGMIKRLFRR